MRGRNKASRDRKQIARIWSWRLKTFELMLLGPSTEDSVGYSLGEDRNVGEGSGRCWSTLVAPYILLMP